MNTNTKFPNNNVVQQNKFGAHFPPCYRVMKPNQIPADKPAADEEDPEGSVELSDLYPLQWQSTTFTKEDATTTNKPTNNFNINDYIKKP